MVKNENTSDDAQVNQESAAKKPARARKQKAESTESKPAAKTAALKKSSSKDAAPVETASKTKGKKPAKNAESSASQQAPAAPTVSATSLLFQAPDLPTPKVDPKRGRIVEAPAADGESHLRRRSRRRATDGVEPSELPPNTVVKVRTPREPKPVSNEPQRVKGSTRLEAKKQRRRDGRDAGRRRSVITESEFLARREAVDRQMIVRSKGGKIQIGVLEDKVLVEHYVAKSAEVSLIGNVYLGKVQNVLPSMEAAFVDIGRGRNAVLYSGEVDWEIAETGNQPKRIELALKSGDTVLVQVTKDPVGQ
ncbi:MAG: hypothetical protein RLZZ400_901, partial [Actinomycetota bacterium]